MIITRTPFRISFFGGGTDYPAWYREHGDAVLSTSIDKYCYVSCRYLPPFFDHRHRIVYSQIESVREVADIKHPAVRAVLSWLHWEPGLEIHHDGDLPARSGIGSSSSFTVGLIHALSALQGRHISKEDLATQAIHVEQDVIQEAVGSQDQVSAAFGGLNVIQFYPDGRFSVDPVELPATRVAQLQSCLMLCFTGISRLAPEVAKSQIENFKARRLELRRMREMVDEALRILDDLDTPIEEFGKLLHDSWLYKRSLSHQVSTPQIDELYQEARRAGAIGGKVLGAGGRGFLLLFARPEQQPSIRERLGQLVRVPFQFETAGSRVALYQPNGL